MPGAGVTLCGVSEVGGAGEGATPGAGGTLCCVLGAGDAGESSEAAISGLVSGLEADTGEL